MQNGIRYTPISYLRLMLYANSGKHGISRIPSYFYSAALNEWVVFHLDALTRSHVTETQFLLYNGKNTLLTQAQVETHEQLISKANFALQNKTYKVDILTSLPIDFSPRFLFENDTILLIAQNEKDVAQFEKSSQFGVKTQAQHLCLENTGDERHHFKWSKKNWGRFCVKTAIEALCLFEGGKKCLRPTFQTARNFVLHGALSPGQDIIFDSKGPCHEKDVPFPVYIDLTIGQNAPQPIPAILPHAEPGMHIITLYEIRGWVLASIVFGGFPASFFILGGPNEHLSDIYELIYDNHEANFDFVRLACDPAKPIIPISLPGEDFSALMETYHLCPVS